MIPETGEAMMVLAATLTVFNLVFTVLTWAAWVGGYFILRRAVVALERVEDAYKGKGAG